MPSSKELRYNVKFYMKNRNSFIYETDYMTEEDATRMHEKLFQAKQLGRTIQFSWGVKEQRVFGLLAPAVLDMQNVDVIEFTVIADDGELRRKRIVNG